MIDDAIEAVARAIVGSEYYDVLPEVASYMRRKSQPNAQWQDRQEARETARAAIAALPVEEMIRQEREAWRPISSAPKDRWILVGSSDQKFVRFGKWYEPMGWHFSTTVRGERQAAELGWNDREHVTHWMPLPAAPAQPLDEPSPAAPERRKRANPYVHDDGE